MSSIVRTNGAGGAGYSTVQDEGSPLPARTKLNFAGAGVTATDDSANSRTTITISGGSGGSGGSGTGLSGGDVVGTYGADPTGVASSTTAFQNAINAGDVLIPAGTYKVGRITYTGSTSRRIVALGRVTLVQTDPLGVFYLKGGWDSLGTVSSYTTVNTNLVTPGETAPSSADVDVTALTMSSAVTVAAGDVLKVVADDQTPFTGDTSYRIGEYVLAGKASTSSTTVTLADTLIETYTTSVRLARLWNVTFRVEGPITFDTDPAIRNTSVWGVVVKFAAAQNCFIGGGVVIQNSLGRAIANNAYATEVDGVWFKDLANRPSLSQYGYGVADNGALLRMTNCFGENLRHLFTTNSEGATAGSTLYEDFGASHHAHVSDCVGLNCQSQVFDCHGDSYGVTFINCKAVGSFPGASSGGFGFSMRGRNNSAIECFVSNSWRGFNVVGENGLLRNCIARNCNYTALEMGGDNVDAPTYTAIKKQRVIGGEFSTTGRSYQTAILGATAGYTTNIELEGVRFVKTAAPGGGGRHIEIYDGVTLSFKDLAFDWGGYTVAHSVIGILANGANCSITGDGIRSMGGSAPVTGFTVIGVNTGTTGAAATPIHATNVVHRHSSLSATVLDGNLTAARSSWRQYFGSSWFNRTGSNDLVLTAAASAVLPIADKLDPVIGVRLTGSAGAVSLAALPTTGLTPGQVVHVANDSNGAVTISGQSAIAAGATASYLFAQGSWWPLAGGSGGASLTVQDEGSALTTRSTINFIGAGVTATDDAANSRTLVTITGGSSGSARAAVARLTSGNLTLANTSWTSVDTTTDLVLTATAGEWVEVSLAALVTTEDANRLFFDAVTVVSSSPVNAVSGQSVSGSRYGVPNWFMASMYKGPLGGSVLYQLQAGDISGGQVRLRLQYSTDNITARTVQATTGSSGQPLIFGGKIVA